MVYRMLAGSVALVHFAWLGFMLLGFYYMLRCYRDRQFRKRWAFRSFHFLGICLVVFFAVFQIKCPLTFLENFFLARYNPESAYAGPFTLHYIERFLVSNPSPWMVLVPTFIIGVFSSIHFIKYPPPHLKIWIRQRRRNSYSRF